MAYKISPGCQPEDLVGEYDLVWVDDQNQQWEGRLLWRDRIGQWYLDICPVGGDPVETIKVNAGMGQGWWCPVLFEDQVFITSPVDAGNCEVVFDDFASDQVMLVVDSNPALDVQMDRTRVSTAGWVVVRE